MRKSELERIVLEVGKNIKDGKPITISVPRQPKLTKKSREAIEKIVDDPKFLGGAMEVTLRLGDLPEEEGGVKVEKQLVKKVIKDNKFYWKNNEMPKTFLKKKKKINKPDKRIDFMKKVAYCQANGYEFVSFGNIFFII